MSRVSGLLFKRRVASQPSTTGISRSIRIRSGRFCSRNLASLFAILGDQHFELIGELKPHLEHLSVVLIVFDVENTEHGSPPLG
jgi:hypothetical protein